jgi:hypothetical protein
MLIPADTTTHTKVPLLRLSKLKYFYPVDVTLNNHLSHRFHTITPNNLTLNSTHYQPTNRTLQTSTANTNQHHSKHSRNILNKTTPLTSINTYRTYNNNNTIINKEQAKTVLNNKRKLKLKIFHMFSKDKDTFCDTYERKNYLYTLKLFDYLKSERRIHKAIQQNKKFHFGKYVTNPTMICSDTESFQSPQKAQQTLDKALTNEEKRLILDDPMYFIKGNANNAKLFKSITLTNRLAMEEGVHVKRPLQRGNMHEHERKYLRKFTRRLTRQEMKEKNMFVKKKKQKDKNSSNDKVISDINNKINKLVYNKHTLDLNSILANKESLMYVENIMRELQRNIQVKQNVTNFSNKMDLNEVFTKKQQYMSLTPINRNKNNHKTRNYPSIDKAIPLSSHIHTRYKISTSKENEYVNIVSR